MTPDHGSDELCDMLSSLMCHGYGALPHILSDRDAINGDKVLETLMRIHGSSNGWSGPPCTDLVSSSGGEAL